MMVSAFRRERAITLMSIGLAADLLAASVLIVAAKPGGILAGCLAVVYSVAALPMHDSPGGGCACFWRLFNTSARRGLLARNALLIVAAIAVALEVPDLLIQGLFPMVALGGVLFLAIRLTELRGGSVADRPGAERAFAGDTITGGGDG